jgi:hypothetical protein
MPPEDANQRLIRSALQQSAEATEALNKLLPELATRENLRALDAGLFMLSQRIDEAESALMAKLDELSEKVSNLGHQGMSAIDIAEKAEAIAKEARVMAGGSPDGGGNGNGHHEPDLNWDPEEDTKPEGLRIVRGAE